MNVIEPILKVMHPGIVFLVVILFGGMPGDDLGFHNSSIDDFNLFHLQMLIHSSKGLLQCYFYSMRWRNLQIVVTFGDASGSDILTNFSIALLSLIQSSAYESDILNHCWRK